MSWTIANLRGKNCSMLTKDDLQQIALLLVPIHRELKKHSEILEEHTLILRRNSDLLDQHTRLLHKTTIELEMQKIFMVDHSSQFKRIDVMLKKHSTHFVNHTKQLGLIKKDQNTILGKLDHEQMDQSKRLYRVEEHLGLLLSDK